LSSNIYLEVVIPCNESQRDLIIAALDDAGYDSVLETDEGLHAYILTTHFNEKRISQLADRFNIDKESISWKTLEEKNWNIEWEKNFEPIVVDDLCIVRAPFHEAGGDNFTYELIIQPKMSFGTGHHATTYLMIKNQIRHIDHNAKKVLDAGCGTAILAVMAEKLGAQKIVAYDIDEWSVENAPENVELNGCRAIETKRGTITQLSLDKNFDIILANINKNVLLEEIPAYVEHLNENGKLLLSGFFKEDVEELDKKALDMGLKKTREDNKDGWACILYKK
jgi:ribosomal protein L11 methyltransferase